MKRIFDKDFKYVDAANTDLHKSFREWRRKQARAQAEPPKVVPIKGAKK